MRLKYRYLVSDIILGVTSVYVRVRHAHISILVAGLSQLKKRTLHLSGTKSTWN